jgi:hypothetical protein
VPVGHQQRRFLLGGLVAAVVMAGLVAVTDDVPSLLRAPLVLGPGGIAYLSVAKLQGAPEVDAVLRPVLRRLPGRRPNP